MTELKPIGTEFEIAYPPTPYGRFVETVWRYVVTDHRQTVDGMAEVIEPVKTPDNPQVYPCRITPDGYERIPQAEIDSGWIQLVRFV